MKTLYLVTRSLDPKGLGRARWMTRWKPALGAFAITFADRNVGRGEPLTTDASYIVGLTDPPGDYGRFWLWASSGVDMMTSSGCSVIDIGRGFAVDPVTLVLAALVAGAAKGVGEATAVAVQDAYASLKSKLLSMFSDDSAAEVVLVEHEADPDTYEGPMRKKLEAAGVSALKDQDDLVLAARRVLTAVDPVGARSGRYLISSISADRGGVAAGHIEGDVTSGYSQGGSPVAPPRR